MLKKELSRHSQTFEPALSSPRTHLEPETLDLTCLTHVRLLLYYGCAQPDSNNTSICPSNRSHTHRLTSGRFFIASSSGR